MIISLNEAFRYQNFLTKLRSELIAYLSDDSFVITKTEEHYRQKAAPGLENEIIDVPVPDIYAGASPNKVIKLLTSIAKERELLSGAVFAAKSKITLSSGFGIDEAVMLNKERRTIAETLKRLAFLQPVPQKLQKDGGRAYLFTQSESKGAAQVSISYDVLVKSRIDYDRNFVKSEYKRILKEADGISAEIDESFAKKIVDFTPKYDYQSSVCEMIDSVVE